MADHGTTVIRDAFVAEVLADPYRPRAQVLAAVIARTGLASARVDSALVLPGSPQWVAEFSPTRLLPPVGEVRTVEQLRDGVASEDAAVRRTAVRNLVRHVVFTDESRELVLAALNHDDAGTRLAAVPGSWRHRNGNSRDPILVRIRELATNDSDPSVRAAAIRRLGSDADNDPRTVTALLSVAASEGDRDVRVAAIQALRSCGRGYRRVLPVAARSMLSDHEPLHRVAWKLVCELADADDVDALAGWLIESFGLHAATFPEKSSLLQNLPTRLPGITPAVVRRLGSGSERDRATAPRLLSYMLRSDDEDAILRIHALQEDYSPFVRSGADVALAMLRRRFTSGSVSAVVRELLW